MKRTATYKIILLLFFAGIGISSIAQSFKADIDRDKILIGEQIHLTLRVEGLKAEQNLIRIWADLPDTFNHVEVVERSKIDTIAVNHDVIYQQNITLTSFDSGQWQIPALKIAFENNGNSLAQLTTQPITINVLPVDVSQLKDYHDIKDILQVDNMNLRWVLIAVIAVTIVSLVAIYLLSRKRRTIVTAAQINKSKQTPLEWAMSSLDTLQKQELPVKGQVKQYYQQLTDICRQYFQLQFNKKALQQTSDELMLSLQSFLVSQDVKTSFFQFIRLSDTVKFAKYLPSNSIADESINIARQMLMEAEKTKYAIPETSKNATT